MHACFHGGGGNSRVTRSVGIIRDFTKSMKVLSIKVKAGGGGRSHARAWRRPAEAEELQLQDKDVAAASASASSSAKIAPAQPQEADGDQGPPHCRKDHRQHEEEEEQGGGKHKHCDKCYSPLDDEGAGEEASAAAGTSDLEWVAEPEPGVLMTLVPRADGTNHLLRIRFSRELFGDAWEAQSWWVDNYDRAVELYSIVQSEHSHDEEEEDDDDPMPVTPCQSEDDEHPRQDGSGALEYSASCSVSASASGGSSSNFSGPSSGSGSANKVDSPILGLVTELNSSTRAAQAQHTQTTGQVKLTERNMPINLTNKAELITTSAAF
ncbi:putative protein Brevis radix-like 5 [Phragmites australis]|uniref:putative protein Brevis radix-like 5 n=1 Tax=Phragmites australis TaxID=29695 RepID=UPI002D772932|nr:putative protein Brevis radix-like 5 [Phragmites australis]